jgi:hypothetical protein
MWMTDMLRADQCGFHAIAQRRSSETPSNHNVAWRAFRSGQVL